MKSSLPLNLEHLEQLRLDGPGRPSELDAALIRQRQQQEVRRLQEDHAGALDIERLIGRLPGGQSEVGASLRRTLGQHGRYVRLSRSLGHSPFAPFTWGERGVRLPDRLAPVLNSKVVGLLERLSGFRGPAGQTGQALTLEAGRAALVLPASAGSLLLAEQGGQVFQYLPTAFPQESAPQGRWQLLEDAAAFQTGPAAMVGEAALGLERQPLAWGQLSSARRRERARRVRLLTLTLCLLLAVLLGRLLTHGGLWLLTGPALIALLLLGWSLERRFAPWVRQGSALRRRMGEQGTGEPLLTAGLPGQGSAQAGFSSPEHERLLSPQTRSQLEALRSALARARVLGGPALDVAYPAPLPSAALHSATPHLTAAVSADLDGLLEDRFSYPAPDAALDTLLEGQMEALRRRLDERLDLERQRARELAAERLRRETIDPHF